MRARPYIKEESIHIFEARCFGAAVQFFCDAVKPKRNDKDEKENAAADILRLFLVRSDKRGRREICKRQLARAGGLIGLGAIDPKSAGEDEDGGDQLRDQIKREYGFDRWHKVHSKAYAASRDSFEERGVGEQVYGAPGPNSCMALLDDVNTTESVVQGAAGLAIETSAGNFQHLYAFDRILAPEDRVVIQRALVLHAQGLGLGGDPRAIGPEQPHRVPGSVNYKPGRSLFVCRLAATWMRVDGARQLRADEWIQRGQTPAAAAPARAAVPGLRGGRPVADGHKSASEAEWAWLCAEVEQSLGREDPDVLAQRLELALVERAHSRRGRDAPRYARLTIFNLRSRKNF